MSSAQFPERFCQAIVEIPERGSLFQRPKNRLQGGAGWPARWPHQPLGRWPSDSGSQQGARQPCTNPCYLYEVVKMTRLKIYICKIYLCNHFKFRGTESMYCTNLIEAQKFLKAWFFPIVHFALNFFRPCYIPVALIWPARHTIRLGTKHFRTNRATFNFCSERFRWEREPKSSSKCDFFLIACFALRCFRPCNVSVALVSPD